MTARMGGGGTAASLPEVDATWTSSSDGVQGTATLPPALDAATIHLAQKAYGMNEVRMTMAPLQRLIVRVLLAPSTLLVALAAIVNGIALRDQRFLLMLGCLMVVQGAVFLSTTLPSRARAWRVCRGAVPECQSIAYREQTWVSVGTALLVPGDLVQLVAGCTVPADCLLYSGSLLVHSADLTGRTCTEAAVPGQQLAAGMRVVDGVGCAVVQLTGSQTFLGRTVSLLEQTQRGFTLSHYLSRTYAGTCVLVAAVALTTVVVLWGVLRGWDRYSLSQMVRETSLCALLCAPLAFDVAVSLAVAFGASAALQRAKAVPLRLSALLTLASVDTLLVDKTGTLSCGESHLTALYRSFLPEYASRAAVVQLMALACRWRGPCPQATKQAVLRCADLEACDGYEQLHYCEYPLEHRSTATLRSCDGLRLHVTEGRVSAVLDFVCASQRSVIAVCAEARRQALTWERTGLRCTAVAVAIEDGPWQLVGLLTFANPLREGAAEFVANVNRLGVRLVVASGDGEGVVTAAVAALHLSTGVMMGRLVPAPYFRRAADGAPLLLHDLAVDMATAPASVSAYLACQAFAEMQPERKAALVRLFQQCGRQVAVMGDGLNDALAAHVSDVGLALVLAHQGDGAAQGSLWGADVALTSDRVRDAAELLVVSREVFGVVHSIAFYTVVVALQWAGLIAALSLAVSQRCLSGPTTEPPQGTPPSRFHPFAMMGVNGGIALWQATLEGDSVYWCAAPCRWNRGVTVLQASGMALMGVLGGAALGVFVSQPCPSPPDAQDRDTMRYVWPGGRGAVVGDVLVYYVLTVNLFLMMSCASPVRAGWRFWHGSRRVIPLLLLLLGGALLCWMIEVPPTVPACVCVYGGLVGVVQDGMKLLMHSFCYHFNCWDCRASVDAMRDQRCAFSEQEDRLFRREAPPELRRPLSPSSEAENWIGCVGNLETRQLCRLTSPVLLPERA